MSFLPSPPKGGSLGLPGALLLVAGLGIVYFTLRWRDEKHGTFGGFFAGKPLDILPPNVTPAPDQSGGTLI